MKGQWIIKEVYFEDGFPKIIRDLKPETPDVTPEVAPDDRGSTVEVPGKLKPSSRRRTVDREDIIRMAREAGLATQFGVPDSIVDIFEKFASFVAAHEREECAKLCDYRVGIWIIPAGPAECAAAIRRREEK
jgi:hypothetical protein